MAVELISKSAQVTKQASELMDAFNGIAKVVKKVSKDGIIPAEYIEIVMEAVAVLPKALDGIDQVPEEAKESPVAFAKGLLLGAADLMETVLKKEELAA